ncbi:MAG TPA: hypothetical protein VK766_02865 [Cytophagaceae bacterium]|jgi:hypothetical protein|nr:hypothetical protein [Cytophagaceae bacterium]
MKKIILIISILLVIGIAILSFFIFGDYSDGSRAGTLVKLSKKGYVFKTWEGELNSYMFVGDQAAASAATSTLFTFSVLSSEKQTIDLMEQAMLNGHRIKLYYKEKYFKFPWNGDTKYFIYKAEVMEK